MPDETPAGAAPGAPPAGGPPPGPPTAQGATSPATVAPDSAGMRMSGMVQVSIALNALEQALPKLGGMKTKEGADLAKAILGLRKTFGNASGDLQRQEMKLMQERTSPVNTPPPGQGAALQSMIKQKLGGMGMGGGSAAPPAAA